VTGSYEIEMTQIGERRKKEEKRDGRKPTFKKSLLPANPQPSQPKRRKKKKKKRACRKLASRQFGCDYRPRNATRHFLDSMRCPYMDCNEKWGKKKGKRGVWEYATAPLSSKLHTLSLVLRRNKKKKEKKGEKKKGRYSFT